MAVTSEAKKNKIMIAAPQRIRCRDAEWLVKKAEIYDLVHKYQKVSCVGLDSLVKNQERIFLEPLDSFEIVDPRNYKFVPDASNGYEKSFFFLESKLRSLPFTGDTANFSELGVFQPYEFQIHSARLALSKPRARLLIADGVGLGKTIQIGMILSELIRRGLAERILVLSKKSMLTQFQAELWNKFNIPLVRMDSDFISRVRTRIPSNKNPFDIYHKAIISLDTLKQKGKYEHFLLDTKWDVVVIDEAHNVAGASSAEGNLSNRLARNLSKNTEHFLLATATPHNGKRETFARLLSLVDIASIPDPDMREYSADDLRGHFLMRFKEDVRSQIGSQMKDRKLIPFSETAKLANSLEIEVLESIAKLRLQTKNAKGKKEATQLLQYGYYKLFLSSPEALQKTVAKRRKAIEAKEENFEFPEEKEGILSLQALVHKLSLQKSTRYEILRKVLKDLKWDGKEASPRILIFTEYLETQKHLAKALAEDFQFSYEARPGEGKYGQETLLTIDGSFSDAELAGTVEAFGTTGNSVRMMIATDVASEGINLHHACHLVIHYDLPWSVITLIQRNGRIDRIGQTQTPEIRYLQVRSGKDSFASDEAIFEKLVLKVEEINRLRKEGETVLNLFDPKKEEEYIGSQVSLGASPERILESGDGAKDEPEFDPDFLKIFEEAREATLQEIKNELNPGQTNKQNAASPTLFPSSASGGANAATQPLFGTRDFFIRAYQYLAKRENYPNLEIQDQFLGFSPPEEVKKRLGDPSVHTDLIFGSTSLPREVWKVVGGKFRLSDKSHFVETAIQAAKHTTGHWTHTSYLNSAHPLLKWLVERMLLEFPRGEAPVLHSPYLPKGSLLYVFLGHVSSKSGYPILALPHSVLVEEKGKRSIQNWEETLGFLRPNQIANTKKMSPDEITTLETMLSLAVETSLGHLKKEAERVTQENSEKVRKEIRRLNQWTTRREEWLRKEFAKITPTKKREWEKLTRIKEEAQAHHDQLVGKARERLEQVADPITEPVLSAIGV